MRNFIISIVTLGGLAAATLLAATAPVEAKPRSCIERYHTCGSHCARTDDWTACYARTCNKQYDTCVASEGPSGGGAKPARLPKPKGKGKGQQLSALMPPSGGMPSSSPHSGPSVPQTQPAPAPTGSSPTIGEAASGTVRESS